jgi:hypothetical protein
MQSKFAVDMKLVVVDEAPTHVVAYAGYSGSKTADADFPTTRRYPTKQINFYENRLDKI